MAPEGGRSSTVVTHLLEEQVVNVSGLLQHFSFEESPVNDGVLASIEGRVRYRGFGYGFSPEVGATCAEEQR